MAISSPGVGSNLNVTQIVSQLMAVERQPAGRLDVKEASFQSQLSAYGTIRSALSSFQSSVDALATPAKFQTRSATSSDTAVATASAGSTAQAGSFQVDVTTLAQNQSLAATGQATTTAAIGTGVSTQLRFEFGTISGGSLASGVYTGATFTPNATALTGTVTIDSTNNSLTGIKDAINAANVGVRASIAGDGSATPYRLMLQSTTSGAAGSMKITVTGDAALQSLLGQDPAGTQGMTQTAVAQDADLTVNGLQVKSKTNSVSDILPGVTVSLSKTGTASITVSRDTSAAQKAVQDFAKAYNELNAVLVGTTGADPKAGTRGPLNGDAAVRTIQAQLRRVMSDSLGSGFTLNTLSQVGVAFQRDGTLAVDTVKLSAAATEKPEALAALFTTSGSSTDSLVSVKKQTSATKAGTYSVDITQIATQGRVTGSAAANLTITTGSNDSLAMTVDGTTATVKLTAGTYTADGLAAMVQSAINGNSTLAAAGKAVTVENSGGVLAIVSKRYGSTSAVTASGAAATQLLGGAPTTSTGVDVDGKLNGEDASGDGRVLSGAKGSATEGLDVEVTGGSTGVRGSVTVGKGFAARLDAVLEGFLSSGGTLSSRTDGIGRSIKDLDQQRTALERRLVDVEARYRAQFTALDVMLSNMTQTSNFLTQQLAALNGG